MLKKLLKYDLKWVYKVIVVFYGLAIIFSIFARMFNSIDNSLLFKVIGNICSSVAIAMLVSSLINTLMRSWVRFVRNIYKDESYLTHTLPVEKKTIYLSKVLSAVISSFTTILVIAICLFICYYSKENIITLKNMLDIAATAYNTTVINLILIISVILFLELLFILLVGYVGIIIGHRSNKSKMTKSIVYGFISYMVSTIGMLLMIYIAGLFNADIMNLIKTTNEININSIKIVLYFVIVLYTIYVIILYIIGKKQLEEGVNVD